MRSCFCTTTAAEALLLLLYYNYRHAPILVGIRGVVVGLASIVAPQHGRDADGGAEPLDPGRARPAGAITTVGVLAVVNVGGGLVRAPFGPALGADDAGQVDALKDDARVVSPRPAKVVAAARDGLARRRGHGSTVDDIVGEVGVRVSAIG
jgi:hypothetical protein